MSDTFDPRYEEHARNEVDEVFRDSTAEFELQHQEYRQPGIFFTKWDSLEPHDRRFFYEVGAVVLTAAYTDQLFGGTSEVVGFSAALILGSILKWAWRVGHDENEQPKGQTSTGSEGIIG